MSTEQMTRDAAIAQLICIMPVVRDIEQVFDFCVDWQKSQPCPRCSELEVENNRLRDALKDQRQFLTWICEDSLNLANTGVADSARRKRVDIDKALSQTGGAG